jgi:hypothetical protein
VPSSSEVVSLESTQSINISSHGLSFESTNHVYLFELLTGEYESQSATEAIPSHSIDTGRPTGSVPTHKLTLCSTSIVDNHAGSRSPAAPFISPLDENRRATICFICSCLGWWKHKSSPTETSLPSFVARGEDQSSARSATTSSRTSTMVDEQARQSISRPWFSLVIRIPACDWTFLRRRTDSVEKPTMNDTPQDRATTLLV